jgi:hypothetical protein
MTTVVTKLHVTVHYIAAAEPFRTWAERSETVGQFQPQVLEAFGLSEGPTPGGGMITYTLYHGKTALTNPAETLGAVAGHHEELQLKLVQEITQG